MEGELAGVEEWRDLYVQSHQLACQLWGAMFSIQYRLDFVWCNSLNHHLLCIAKIATSNLARFLIPLVKML
jgi:hypothetical protein